MGFHNPERRWVPTSRPTSIEYWRWTRRDGLRVKYLGFDGEVRSDWRTLPAFILAVSTGREGPVRELAASEWQ